MTISAPTRPHIAVIAMLCTLISTSAYAKEVEIKMLNKGSDGSVMVFEPALVYVAVGDNVHFVAVDKSHNVEAIPAMLPAGVAPFTGNLNQDVTIKMEKPGIYGYRCKPHYGMGMVGLIVVGKPTNEEAVKTALASGVPPFAKNRFLKLFAQIDAGK